MFLLDTNACIKVLNDSSAILVARLKSHHPTELRMSAVVQAELLHGARKSSKPADNLRVLTEFFRSFRSLAFDDACAEQYGRLRADLERLGTPIGPYDMMIAATAIANELTLVTHNRAEFSRVPGLEWEDWET